MRPPRLPLNKINLTKTYNKSANYISDGSYNAKSKSRSPNRSDVGSARNININAQSTQHMKKASKINTNSQEHFNTVRVVNKTDRTSRSKGSKEKGLG